MPRLEDNLEGGSPGGDVLVVRVGALGDTLMAVPVASAFKSSDPDRQVDFLCSSSAAPLLRGHPAIRRIHTLVGRNVPFWISPEKWGLARRIARGGYRFAVLLESASRYRLLLEKAGVREIRSFAETPFDPELHSAANNLRAAGLDWRQFPLETRLKPTNSDRAAAKTMLAGLPPPLIGLHAGYGPVGKKRNQMERLKGWSPGRFAELARELMKSGASLVFTGSSGDRPEVVGLAADLPAERVRVLAGRTTVGELAGVLSELRLFISVDSGPAHMAAAVGTPLIVLWGPAKLCQVRPLSDVAPVVVLRKPVPCAPCYDTPAMKSCRANICMQSILSSDVMFEVRKLLS